MKHGAKQHARGRGAEAEAEADERRQWEEERANSREGTELSWQEKVTVGRKGEGKGEAGRSSPWGSPVEASSIRKIKILNWSPPSAGEGLEITTAGRGGDPARQLAISKDLRAVLVGTGRVGGCSV